MAKCRAALKEHLVVILCIIALIFLRQNLAAVGLIFDLGSQATQEIGPGTET